jgi:hypothetical protein
MRWGSGMRWGVHRSGIKPQRWGAQHRGVQRWGVQGWGVQGWGVQGWGVQRSARSGT